MNIKYYKQQAKDFERLFDNKLLLNLPPTPKNVFSSQQKNAYSTLMRNHWLDRAEVRHRARHKPSDVSKDGVLYGFHFTCMTSYRLLNELSSDEYVEEVIDNFDEKKDTLPPVRIKKKR